MLQNIKHWACKTVWVALHKERCTLVLGGKTPTWRIVLIKSNEISDLTEIIIFSGKGISVS